MRNPLEMAAYETRPDHQIRANFWLGFLLGLMTRSVFDGVAAIFAWIWSN